jgi:hypothetical protein
MLCADPAKSHSERRLALFALIPYAKASAEDEWAGQLRPGEGHRPGKSRTIEVNH